MSSTNINPIGTSGQQATGFDAFKNVNLQDFVKLLVTELQQQDPMEPMNSSEILQQVSQIREIESTQRLTDTMDAVVLGQNLATASGLLDRRVLGLDDTGYPVTGVVEKVSIEGGAIKIYVGDKVVDLKNVAQILPK